MPPQYYANQPQPRLLPSYVPSPDTSHKPLNDPEVRIPVSLRTIFVIDVSTASANSGVLESICDGIREALYGDPPNETTTAIDGVLHPDMKVAIVTFDGSLQFYDLSVRHILLSGIRYDGAKVIVDSELAL